MPESENDGQSDDTTTETTTDSNGNTVETVKNADGTIVSIRKIDSDEREIYFEANGEITETTFDSNENSTIITRKSGSTNILTTTRRDSSGKKTEYVDHKKGIVKIYEYQNNSNSPTSESTEIDGVKLKKYTSRSEENGQKTVTSTDYAGSVTSVVTDALTGLTVSTTDGNDNTTEYTYDSLKNLTSLLDVNTNGKNTFTYENGNIKTITTNANGTKQVVYSFDYDCFGNVTAIKLGNVALVTYNYDNISHLPLTITYANGNILTYAYNSKGELASLTGSSSLNEQYEYDEVGQLYKTIDNANNTVTVTAINGTVVVWNSAQTQVLHRYSADDKAFCEEINGIEYKTEFSSAEKTADAPASTTVTVDGNLFAYCENNPNMNFDYCGYAKMNIKWLGTAIDLILWLIPALYAFSKICKEVSKSASKLVSFGNKLISAGKKLFKRFDNRLYCAFAKDSTYRMVKTIGVLAGIVSIISSPGNIVQYIIDILDGKWDGYLDTKRFGPKLDLTRDY